MWADISENCELLTSYKSKIKRLVVAIIESLCSLALWICKQNQLHVTHLMGYFLQMSSDRSWWFGFERMFLLTESCCIWMRHGVTTSKSLYRCLKKVPSYVLDRTVTVDEAGIHCNDSESNPQWKQWKIIIILHYSSKRNTCLQL